MSNTPDNIRNMWEQAALEEGKKPNSKKDIGTHLDDPFRASNRDKELTSAARVAREKRWAEEKEAERAKKPAGG